MTKAVTLHQSGQLSDAEALYNAILRADENNFDARHLLGVIRYQQGHYQDAVTLIGEALKRNPNAAEAHNNLGSSLQNLNRLEEAMSSYRRALEIAPNYAEANHNLGTALMDKRLLDESVACYRRALEIKPDYAEAHQSLGNALRRLRRYEEAVASFERALELKPGFAEAHNNLGNTLKEMNRHEEAIASYRRALDIRPGFALAHKNLGTTLLRLGRFDEAITSFRRALEIKPEDRAPFSNLADARRRIADWMEYADAQCALTEDVRRARYAVSPFVFLTFSDSPGDQFMCARHYAEERVGSGLEPMYRGPRLAGDRIRLGYLSGDFREHAAAYLTAELFELHDRDQFEVFAFSFGLDDGSAMRRRLEQAFDHFIDVREQSDAEVARRMADSGIHIVIDLMGYTQDSRAGILSRRPAPIQVNYLGFPGTMGADFIDYIVVDPFVVPRHQQAFFSEKIVHLPDCYQVNDRKRPISKQTPSRAECGLPEAGFVFCCFNNTYKITPGFFDVWMRLLVAVPGSVLWLLRDNDAAERNLRREAKIRGVDPDRIVFAPRLGLAEHLARQGLADLFLDTLPVNAHTTASDALWAGLPVLTCAGRAFAGRVAGSLLRAVGLPDLVTESIKEYEARALDLARSPERLRSIRDRLSENRLAAPLFDSDRFRRNIEAAYIEMYRTWESGQSPRPIAVETQPEPREKPFRSRGALIAEAVALHERGDLPAAEAKYRDVLDANGGDFDARHLLGVVRYQLGRYQDAVTLIGKALESNPNSAEAHNNLGTSLRNLGRPKEAIGSYRRALELKPDYAAAHNNLGVALVDLGRYDRALASFQRALELQPEYVEAHKNLGNALNHLKRYEEAAASLRRVVEIDPDSATSYVKLGITLRDLNQYEDSANCFRRALEIQPDYAEACSKLGAVLGDLKRYDEAITFIRRALEIRPDLAEAYCNLGACQSHLQLHQEAVDSYRRALKIKPDYAEVLANLGIALGQLNRHRESADSYRRALEIEPDYAEVHKNLGNALWRLHRHDEALASYRRALELKPEDRAPFSELADSQRRIADWTEYADAERALREDVQDKSRVANPFVFLTFSDRPEEQLQCAKRYVKELVGSEFEPTYRRPMPAGDRLRLGYLSGDFRKHAVAYLTAELFEIHDRERFEVFGFSFGPDDGSAMRQRLERGFDHFVDVRGESDVGLARRISDPGIHILIDLMGHTGENRLSALAHRPAPIQVNYLGFPGTTGANFIDYILVDPFVVPADQQRFFSEKLVHLPDCYQVNDRKRAISKQPPSRAGCGLPDSGFVFCSFNGTYKITPRFFDVWMRLLTAVPGSVLWLLRDNDAVENNLRREAESRGVDPDRLIFARRTDYADYLARFELAHLFLDTLPYNGGATAGDALWTGLPLLTCTGRSFASRMAGSLLRAVGLPELVTDSIEEYEALALNLARDPGRLGAIRERLGKNRLTAPLFDTDRFRRNIEAAYTEMYRTWECGEPPRPIAVTSSAESIDSLVAGTSDDGQ